MTDDFIDEDTGGDIVPTEPQEVQKPKRGRVATAECPYCHYRFPKPEMHKVETYKETGRSSGYSMGAPGKRKSTNPRFSSRTYQRKVTQWVCNDCYQKGLANPKGCLGSVILVIAVVSSIAFVVLV
ncbi:MAG: hypothetical protein OXG62_05355 [Nitrospinae bacterium]|nr:hypothetical protein [Nitrospinota bacterium]